MEHAVFNKNVPELEVLVFVEFGEVVAVTGGGHWDSECFANFLELRRVAKLEKFGFQFFDGHQQERDQVGLQDELLGRGALDSAWVASDLFVVGAQVIVFIELIDCSNNVVPLLDHTTQSSEERLSFLIATVNVH